MSYCLWLDGKKVSRLDELYDNFHLNSLKSYYYGGSLVAWLQAHEGGKIAERLMNANGTAEEKILFAFGIADSEKTSEIPVDSIPHFPAIAQVLGEKNSSFLPMNGSFQAFFSSLPLSSYLLSSGGLWQGSWLNALYEIYRLYGSFGAFGMSGMGMSGLWGMSGFSGSFGFGSFGFGSFGFGSFGWGSFDWSSFDIHQLWQNGSWVFSAADDDVVQQYCQYKAMLSYISSCPLNMYGYGIHII